MRGRPSNASERPQRAADPVRQAGTRDGAATFVTRRIVAALDRYLDPMARRREPHKSGSADTDRTILDRVARVHLDWAAWIRGGRIAERDATSTHPESGARRAGGPSNACEAGQVCSRIRVCGNICDLLAQDCEPGFNCTARGLPTRAARSSADGTCRAPAACLGEGSSDRARSRRCPSSRE